MSTPPTPSGTGAAPRPVSGTEAGLHPAKTPRFNETVIAIVGAMVFSAIVATLLTGNPFRVLVLAYTDYSQTPAAGAPKASTTDAPATAAAPK